MEKIYQGEDLSIVFRCKKRDCSDADMSGRSVKVVWLDKERHELYRFSTNPINGEKQLQVNGNILVCTLHKSDTAALKGLYSVEVKITDNGISAIERVDGIRVWGSNLGKEITK